MRGYEGQIQSTHLDEGHGQRVTHYFCLSSESKDNYDDIIDDGALLTYIDTGDEFIYRRTQKEEANGLDGQWVQKVSLTKEVMKQTQLLHAVLLHLAEMTKLLAQQEERVSDGE